MAWSAAETFEHVASKISSDLVSSQARQRIAKLCSKPVLDWTSYYIEVRLEPDVDQVDFLAGLRPADASGVIRGLQAGENGAGPHGSSWKPFVAFGSRWLDKESSLHRQVPAVWVELDHAGNLDPDQVVPSFCVCLAHEYPCEGTLAADPQAAIDALHSSLDLLLPGELEGGTHQCLERTLQALGPFGRVIHLSVMTGRSPVAIKLYLSVARGDLLALGKKLRCSTAFERVERLLRELSIKVEPIYLDLTVGGEISPRIGIAFSQYHASGPDFDPNWGALLDACVACGISCPNKRLALAAWPGRGKLLYQGESWPARVDRYLDIKLVSQESSLTAKAYLGFHPKAALL